MIDSAEVLIGDHHNIRNFALPHLAYVGDRRCVERWKNAPGEEKETGRA